MKKNISYILIVSYSLISINAFIPLINYAFNYSYIVEELCVERDLEVNNCKGNCQLKTQVSKNLETEKESKTPKPISIKELETPYFPIIGSQKESNIFNSKLYISFQLAPLENYLDKQTPPPKSSA
jgi:hypothetical protein